MKSKNKTLTSILFRHSASLTGAAFVFATAAAMADTTLNAPLVLTTPANLGAITRTSNGATLTLTGAGYTTTNTDTNGILGGWAVINNGTTYSWAHNDGSSIVAATPVVLGTSFSGDNGTVNWTNTDGNTTLTAATQVNSYVGASDVTISGVLTVNSGGMILGNNGSKWIKNGTSGQITSGLASGELFVYTPNPAATDMRIQVPLVNNGATPTILVKDGVGRLDLEAANTFTGTTILNQGNLYLRNANALGSSSGLIVTGNIGFATATNVTISGPVTGSGTLDNGFVDGSASLSLNGDLSGFTGTFAHNTSNTRNNFNLGGATAASMNASLAKLVMSGSTTQARNVNINGTGDPVFKIGDLSGTGGKINANNSTTLQVGALGLNSTFAGNISSNGGFQKTGAGTLVLSAANTYTGATAVNGGTLQIGNGTAGSIAAGSAVTVGASGTLALNLAAAGTFSNTVTNNGNISAISGNAMTLSGAIDGTGSLQKSGAGTLTVSGFNSYSGSTAVSAGTLLVTGSIASSATTLGAATLSGNGTLGGVTVNDFAAVIANGNSSTATLALDSLTFTTGATLNLNKVNDTFTPALAITGNLTTTAGIAVNLTTAPVLANGTYDLISYGGTFTGSIGHLVMGTIPGLGGRQSATLVNTGSAIALAIAGDSPFWTGAQDNTWSTTVGTPNKNWRLITALTATDFQNNDQVLFDDNATGSTSINISAANVQVAAVTFENFSKDYTISSTGGFGIADFSSAASLIKSGNGTVTLNTTNGYTGPTTITAGTLRLGDGTTNGDIASSSSIANDGTLILNRSAGSFTYGNATRGFGEIIKNGVGTQIFAGASTRSGITTINSGTIQVGNAGTTGALGSGLITNNASLVFNRSNAVVQGTDFGFIDGTGSLAQSGSGTLTLTNANSYSGGSTINSGTIILVGANEALGTGAVNLTGGTLGSTGGNVGLSNLVVAQTSTTSVLSTNGTNLALNGNLSGSGNLNRTATGAAASVYLGGDNSGFSGTFTVENNANAATRFTSATSGSANAKWVINQPTSTRATVDSPGNSIQFGSLTGTGFLTAQGIGTTTIQVGNLGLNESFTGVLNELGGGSILAVTKTGAGTWTLTGTNTYTGGTTVNAGILAVDGDAIANTAKLVINGGKVDPSGATEVVGTLYFGATQQAAGTWGATGSTATHIDDTHFTGTGVVSVTTGPAGYTSWADANGASGQTKNQDHDGDGVSNGIEYFMGQTGSTFTANPAPVSGTITWPMAATYTGIYGTDYEVQYSTDLVAWTQVPIGTGDNTLTVTAGTSVVYDVPTGGKSFVRLVVRN